VITTIGIKAPDDFPTLAYNRLHDLITSQQRTQAIFNEYTGSWNAVASRFTTCAVQEQRFTASYQQFGSSPTPDERYAQDDALFIFFTAALSTIESFFYAMNAVGAFKNPNAFSLTPERGIVPSRVKQRFEGAFAQDDITRAMTLLLSDGKFTRLSVLRNIVSHRQSPARAFDVGGPQDGVTIWNAQNDVLTAEFLVNWRKWLANQMIGPCGSAVNFANRHL